MESTNITSTVYMKDILFSIFYRWKRIFAVVIIFALVLSGLYCGKNICANAGIDPTPIVPQPNAQQVAALEEKIEFLSIGVTEKEKYLESSAYMQLNPYAYYEASLNIYVDTNYQILPELSYQTPNMVTAVLSAYVKLLQSQTTLDILAEALETEPEYLSEVYQYYAEPGTQTLHITAQCANEALASSFADAVLSCIDSYHGQISETVDEHTTTVLTQDVFKRANGEIETKQQENIDSLKPLKDALTAAQQELDSLTAPIVNMPASLDKKKAVVYAVVGAFAGGFLSICYIIATFLFDSKVYSVRTLRDRAAVKVLCCARGNRKRLPDTLWLRRLEGRINATLEQQYPLLAAHIRNRCIGGQTVLVTGSADSALAEQTANYLRCALPELTVVFEGNILYDVAALSNLAKCDCVVLAEQCGRTRYAQIIQAQELIEDHNKTLLGCLLIDG